MKGAEQPTALRLADEMENYWNERGPDAEVVAAELRRLHEENRILHSHFNKEEDKFLARIADLEKALGMAVESMENAHGELCAYSLDLSGEDYNSPSLNEALTTARQTLGGKHE